MLLKVVDEGKFRDIPISEGEMFLLPREWPHQNSFRYTFAYLTMFCIVANTPHNPVRFADTVGIVLEQPRPEKSMDRLRWYCQVCGQVVYEAAFHCTDLGTQIKDAVNSFRNDDEKRRCGNCGALADVVPKSREDQTS
jgi:3-hydroxyanthranilate 3,4-dioxygenase